MSAPKDTSSAPGGRARRSARPRPGGVRAGAPRRPPGRGDVRVEERGHSCSASPVPDASRALAPGHLHVLVDVAVEKRRKFRARDLQLEPEELEPLSSESLIGPCPLPDSTRASRRAAFWTDVPGRRRDLVPLQPPWYLGLLAVARLRASATAGGGGGRWVHGKLNRMGRKFWLALALAAPLAGRRRLGHRPQGRRTGRSPPPDRHQGPRLLPLEAEGRWRLRPSRTPSGSSSGRSPAGNVSATAPGTSRATTPSPTFRRTTT